MSNREKLRRLIDTRDVIETQLVNEITGYQNLKKEDQQQLALKVKAVLVTQFDALVDSLSGE